MLEKVDQQALIDAINTTMPFGKYAGRPLLELPEPYLVWFIYPNYLKMPASELSQRFQRKAHLRRNVVTFRTSVTP